MHSDAIFEFVEIEMNQTAFTPRALLVAMALSIAVGTPVVATAQATQPETKTASAAAADFTDGEVRKVDAGSRKVTLKHAEIKNLDMPPMTMTFNVKDAALLDRLQVGDRIRFRAEKDSGSYWVTAIERLK